MNLHHSATRGADASLPPLIAIIGPTASGKTDLAMRLAQSLPDLLEGSGVEVVSADSRQIYRLMDIATAKPTAAERARAPHHLLDVAWPNESYTLAEYQRDAQMAIAAIQARGSLPLLVGGTGLYVRAVVDGLAIPVVAPQLALRAELEADSAAHGPAALIERLRAVDPASASTLDPTNARRLIRAIEVSEVTGMPFSAQRGNRPTPYRTALTLGLNMERTLLYERADQRIARMVEQGLIEETRGLLEHGFGWELPSMSSLGYREIGSYLRGELPLDEAIKRFEYATHAYIRRQLTWFRADVRIQWLNAAASSAELMQYALDAIRFALTANQH
jgi:tRNA dimethylallyltransferase